MKRTLNNKKIMIAFNIKNSLFFRAVLSFVLLAFLGTTIVPSSFAQVLATPASALVPLSPAFTPTLVRGIRVYPDNPLKFDFIVDSGDTGLKGDELKKESEKLIRYFLASLTIPEDELWVNLSPYEKDRIVPDELGSTEMGRDMLAQDYLLKQITASLTNPDSDLGKEFWAKIYKKAYEQYGTTNIPVDTFNKVWIMPEKAVVYEQADKAFVVESKLKVMLEQDYLAAQKAELSAPTKTNDLSSQVVRDIFIPALEKEVNNGKNFAQLRQIYNAIILGYWFKTKLKNSILNKVYSNQHKVSGIDLSNKANTDKIYAQYLDTFKKGVCNMMKVEYDPYAKKTIPRKYFAGGVSWKMSSAVTTTSSSAAGSSILSTLKKAIAILLFAVVFQSCENIDKYKTVSEKPLQETQIKHEVRSLPADQSEVSYSIDQGTWTRETGGEILSQQKVDSLIYSPAISKETFFSLAKFFKIPIYYTNKSSDETGFIGLTIGDHMAREPLIIELSLKGFSDTLEVLGHEYLHGQHYLYKERAGIPAIENRLRTDVKKIRQALTASQQLKGVALMDEMLRFLRNDYGLAREKGKSDLVVLDPSLFPEANISGETELIAFIYSAYLASNDYFYVHTKQLKYLEFLKKLKELKNDYINKNPEAKKFLFEHFRDFNAPIPSALLPEQVGDTSQAVQVGSTTDTLDIRASVFRFPGIPYLKRLKAQENLSEAVSQGRHPQLGPYYHDPLAKNWVAKGGWVGYVSGPDLISIFNPDSVLGDPQKSVDTLIKAVVPLNPDHKIFSNFEILKIDKAPPASLSPANVNADLGLQLQISKMVEKGVIGEDTFVILSHGHFMAGMTALASAQKNGKFLFDPAAYLPRGQWPNNSEEAKRLIAIQSQLWSKPLFDIRQMNSKGEGIPAVILYGHRGRSGNVEDPMTNAYVNPNALFGDLNLFIQYLKSQGFTEVVIITEEFVPSEKNDQFEDLGIEILKSGGSFSDENKDLYPYMKNLSDKGIPVKVYSGDIRPAPAYGSDIGPSDKLRLEGRLLFKDLISPYTYSKQALKVSPASGDFDPNNVISFQDGEKRYVFIFKAGGEEGEFSSYPGAQDSLGIIKVLKEAYEAASNSTKKEIEKALKTNPKAKEQFEKAIGVKDGGFNLIEPPKENTIVSSAASAINSIHERSFNLLFRGDEAEMKALVKRGKEFLVEPSGGIGENRTVYKNEMTSLANVQKNFTTDQGDPFEEFYKKAKADPERTFIVVDAGSGAGIALKEMADKFRLEGVNNVKLYGFSHIYYPEWAEGEYPEITWIVDSFENINEYFGSAPEKLGPVDFMFSHLGFYHIGRGEGQSFTTHINFMEKISGLLASDAEVVYDYSRMLFNEKRFTEALSGFYDMRVKYKEIEDNTVQGFREAMIIRAKKISSGLSRPIVKEMTTEESGIFIMMQGAVPVPIGQRMTIEDDLPLYAGIDNCLCVVFPKKKTMFHFSDLYYLLEHSEDMMEYLRSTFKGLEQEEAIIVNNNVYLKKSQTIRTSDVAKVLKNAFIADPNKGEYRQILLYPNGTTLIINEKERALQDFEEAFENAKNYINTLMSSGQIPSKTHVISSSISSEVVDSFENDLEKQNQLVLRRSAILVNGEEYKVSIDDSFGKNIRYLRVGPIVVMTSDLVVSKEFSDFKNNTAVVIEKSLSYREHLVPVIAAMLEQDLKGKVVKDYGSGNGVLTLVALRLGAKMVVGVEREADIEQARSACESAGYRTKYLTAEEWKNYTAGESDQVILIKDDLKNVFENSEILESRILKGQNTIVISNTGPEYSITDDIIIDVLRNKNPIVLIGGYFGDPAQRHQGVFADGYTVSTKSFKYKNNHVACLIAAQKSSSNAVSITLPFELPKGSTREAFKFSDQVIEHGLIAEMQKNGIFENFGDVFHFGITEVNEEEDSYDPWNLSIGGGLAAREAFQHILDNSIFAIEKRRAREAGYTGKITVSLLVHNNVAELIVEDDGVGINSDVMKKLFKEPILRVDEEGNKRISVTIDESYRNIIQSIPGSYVEFDTRSIDSAKGQKFRFSDNGAEGEKSSVVDRDKEGVGTIVRFVFPIKKSSSTLSAESQEKIKNRIRILGESTVEDYNKFREDDPRINNKDAAAIVKNLKEIRKNIRILEQSGNTKWLTPAGLESFQEGDVVAFVNGEQVFLYVYYGRSSLGASLAQFLSLDDLDELGLTHPSLNVDYYGIDKFHIFDTGKKVALKPFEKQVKGTLPAADKDVMSSAIGSIVSKYYLGEKEKIPEVAQWFFHYVDAGFTDAQLDAVVSKALRGMPFNPGGKSFGFMRDQLADRKQEQVALEKTVTNLAVDGVNKITVTTYGGGEKLFNEDPEKGLSEFQQTLKTIAEAYDVQKKKTEIVLIAYDHNRAFLQNYSEQFKALVGAFEAENPDWKGLVKYHVRYGDILDETQRKAMATPSNITFWRHTWVGAERVNPEDDRLNMDEMKVFADDLYNAIGQGVLIVNEEVALNNDWDEDGGERDYLFFQKVKVSSAVNSAQDRKGGIDFNAKNMNVQTRGEGIDFNLSENFKNLRPEDIIGFTPVIINITPVTDFMKLLGLNDDERKKVEKDMEGMQPLVLLKEEKYG